MSQPGVDASEVSGQVPVPTPSHVPAPFVANRGVLHAEIGSANVYGETRLRFCQHELKARRLSRWRRGSEAPLFFADEAIALAAGCRPCWSCRPEDYKAFKSAWETTTGHPVDAQGMDTALGHRALDDSPDEIVGSATEPSVQHQRTWEAEWASLPDGVFVVQFDGLALVDGGSLIPWSQDSGYGEPVARPNQGSVQVVTPKVIAEVLRAGYVPVVSR